MALGVSEKKGGAVVGSGASLPTVIDRRKDSPRESRAAISASVSTGDDAAAAAPPTLPLLPGPPSAISNSLGRSSMLSALATALTRGLLHCATGEVSK